MFMRQLTYLIALDKHRHFGRAADSCHDICLVRLRREMQPAWSEGAWRLAANLDLQAILDQPPGPRF
jgi:hypothetical protein